MVILNLSLSLTSNSDRLQNFVLFMNWRKTVFIASKSSWKIIKPFHFLRINLWRLHIIHQRLSLVLFRLVSAAPLKVAQIDLPTLFLVLKLREFHNFFHYFFIVLFGNLEFFHSILLNLFLSLVLLQQWLDNGFIDHIIVHTLIVGFLVPSLPLRLVLRPKRRSDLHVKLVLWHFLLFVGLTIEQLLVLPLYVTDSDSILVHHSFVLATLDCIRWLILGSTSTHFWI